MTIDYKTISAKIQYFRTLRGVSQENLAEAAAVSRVSISNLERGETGTTLETLVSIANALRITTDDILADIVIEEKPSDLCAHFDIFGDCTKDETDFLIAMLQNTKQVIRKFRITK